MTPSELTTLLGVLTALLATFIWPVYLQKRKERENLEDRAEVSWESINKAIAKERDDQRAENKAMKLEHALEIEKLKAIMALNAKDYDKKLAEANIQIKHCNDEVNRLYRELHQGRGIPPYPDDSHGQH